MGKTHRKIPVVRWGFHKNYRNIGKIVRDQVKEVAANEAATEFIEDLKEAPYVGPRPQWLRITKWAGDDLILNKGEVYKLRDKM